MRIQLMVRTIACAIVVMNVACGGETPTGPSGASAGPSGTGGGPTVGRGTITAQIDGATFTGVATTAANQSGIFAAAASNNGGTITLGFGALATVGTTSIGVRSPTNANMVVISGGSVQSWAASTSGGTGTLTISSMTATGATGTFSFTMVPVPGSGASGTKSVTNGTFTVTF